MWSLFMVYLEEVVLVHGKPGVNLVEVVLVHGVPGGGCPSLL